MFKRILLALSLLLLLPTSAFAYSYGDPNKEDVAEAYKEIAAKLEKNPADWNGAYQAFLSRKKEIAQHFGEQTANVLENNFSQQNKDLVLHNYKAVLVLNIDRRLDYAEKEFDDYAQAKLLLAKGRGTLDVLAPTISDSGAKTAYAAFDKALKALGNPGLFGVGTVPSDKNEFLKQTALIRSTLKPFYPLKASAQSAAPKPAPAKTVPAQPKPVKPTAQPAKPVTPTAATGTTTANKPEAATSTPGTAAQTATPANTPVTEANTATQQPAQPADAAGKGTATAAPAPAPDSGETTATAHPESSASAATAQPAAESQTPSKVNPAVTASVLVGLALFIGGAFWFAKRKGLI
jgi:hypothetical protein